MALIVFQQQMSVINIEMRDRICPKLFIYIVDNNGSKTEPHRTPLCTCHIQEADYLNEQNEVCLQDHLQTTRIEKPISVRHSVKVY